MRISLSVDMEAEKTAAKAQVDQEFQRRSKLSSWTDSIRRMKLDEALSNSPDKPILTEEAAMRGITVEELAALVIQRDAAHRASISRMETRRQWYHRAIENAATPKALSLILAATTQELPPRND